MTKLKNSNGDKTKKLKLWQNSKTQNVKNLIVTKLKFWQNSNCDKTLNVTRLKMWQTQFVTKLKTQILIKLKNSKCDKTQKLKVWQNWKTQLVTKLKYDKSQFMTKNTLKESFSKNILTPWQPMRCSLGSFLRFSRYFGWKVSFWQG